MDVIRQSHVKAILFDFDGTVSTLRAGWEKVMGPLFLEVLSPDEPPSEVLKKEVEQYIDESTGIQTVLQMSWLVSRVKDLGRVPEDVWTYKDQYNARLMRSVEKKLERLSKGEDDREDYLIPGVERFLLTLKEKNVRLFVASGTDDTDVHREASLLGVGGYFEQIKGAPYRSESCSKEAVIRQLLYEQGLSGSELAVIGDGKVEISLGREAGALTIGIACDERTKDRMDEKKREKLTRAGADVIFQDFTPIDRLLEILGLTEGEIR